MLRFFFITEVKKEMLLSLRESSILNSFLNFRKGLSYSTVTDFAKFLGLSTSNPFSFEM